MFWICLTEAELRHIIALVVADREDAEQQGQDERVKEEKELADKLTFVLEHDK